VLVGEFGTKLEASVDRQWFSGLTSYLGARGVSFTFWSLNPDPEGAGGLALDWTTVDADKMSYLTPLLAPRLPVK
jgi:endoglucanase